MELTNNTTTIINMERFNLLRIFEILPINGRKSFGGKCKVLEDKNHNFYLLSYETIVAYFDGKIHKVYSEYTHTTQCHINSFLHFVGICEKGKKYWDSLPLETL